MSAVLAKVMHEMGLPPAWIAELSQIPRKTVDDIIKGMDPGLRCPEMNYMTGRRSNPPGNRAGN
jgi:predicted transcriptional regulator